MQYLSKLLGDIIGVARVLGYSSLLKWAANIILNFDTIVKHKNLESADVLMGKGPFRVSYNKKSAIIYGHQSFSGIREIWVRDCYLNKQLNFDDDNLVIDLGANIGVFTQLALSQNKSLKVISVEPNRLFVEDLKKSLKYNKWEDRCKIHIGFIGSTTKTQIEALKNKNYQSSEFININNLIKNYSINKVDFLKVDVEGSEFGLLDEESKLLSISKKLAIEIHDNGGSVNLFIDSLKNKNFSILNVVNHRGGCVVLAKNKSF